MLSEELSAIIVWASMRAIEVIFSHSRKKISRLIILIGLVLVLHWFLMLSHLAGEAPHHEEQHPFYLMESQSARARTANPKKIPNMSSINDSKPRKVPHMSSRNSEPEPIKEEPNIASSNPKNTTKDPYILSSICGGCYRAYSGDVPCYDIIQKRLQRSGTTLSEAMQSVGTSVSGCEVCNPYACYKPYINGNNTVLKKVHQFKYWRYDEAAPQYTSAADLSLSSIPNHLRIPPSRYDDIETYIRQIYKNPDPTNTTNSFLVEYNPSLAVIPTSMKGSLPLDAKYIATLRVTPYNQCFSKQLEDALPMDIKQTMDSLNHLGIALLDSQYQVIPGYDVVLDLDVQLDVKMWKKKGKPAFIDYRIYALNEELYLHVNADTVVITKLRLNAKGFGSDGVEKYANNDGEKQIKLKNLYGGGDQLEVTLLHQFNSIWGTMTKEKRGKWKNHDKNFALFSLPNSIYAEITVHPDHLIRQILPDEYEMHPWDGQIKTRERRNFKLDNITQRMVKTLNESSSNSKSLLPSFFTVDDHWFPGRRDPYKSFAHGGACCIFLSLDDIAPYSHRRKLDEMDSLLVGVGHNLINVRRRRRYFMIVMCYF